MLRFDGRVAVVTGAGRGIGREYALLLGSRGCKVVVNDLGGSTFGEGSDSTPAQKVCDEIIALGGEAVPNFDSVEFGDKIVKTAIDKWGRIDIVINNAGILRDKSFLKMTDADFDIIYRVHLLGTYKVCKAAWPYMREQKYGRIINITSAAGLYGNFGQANYSSMKLAVVGLTRTLAKEGARRNIKVNVIAPISGSRMTETVMPKKLVDALKPTAISPVVCYLSHEECEETGLVFELGAGWVSCVRQQRSQGVIFDMRGGKGMTMEEVRDKIDEVMNFEPDEDGTDTCDYPENTQSAMGQVMAALTRSGSKL